MAVIPNTFTVWDYVVFVLSFLVSMGIGVYFALKGRNQRTQEQYLMGGRKLAVLPVAISMLVSTQSAIMLLGTPAEMYLQGTEYYEMILGIIVFGMVFSAIFVVPLLYPLKLTSAQEYLESRYRSRHVRLLGTAYTMLAQVMYVGTAAYAPATGFEAVTGIPVWVTLLVSGVVTTFYTTIGGMRAVIWTDVFQGGIMLAGLLAIFIQGTIKAGGFMQVWETTADWDRLRFFTTDPDPRVRHSLYSLVIGGGIIGLGTAFNQPIVQRFSSLPTLGKAQLSLFQNMIGSIVLMTLACLSGIVMFAYYVKQDCDPLGQGLVDNSNQLMPFFVMDILAYPTVPGLFMASLFSGALSSMSSSLNALAAITWEDMLKPSFGHRFTEVQRTFLLKILVFIYGSLGIGISFVMTYLDGTITQAVTAMLSPVVGAVSGMYLLGTWFPQANKYGAIIGSALGLVIAAWQATGSYLTGIMNQFLDLPFPDGRCDFNETEVFSTPVPGVLQVTIATPADVGGSSLLDDFYSLSYMWIGAIAFVITVVVGLIVSLITRGLIPEEERQVPLKYQMAFGSRLCSCLPKSWLYYLDCCRPFSSAKSVPDAEEDSTKKEQRVFVVGQENTFEIREKGYKNGTYYLVTKM